MADETVLIGGRLGGAVPPPPADADPEREERIRVAERLTRLGVDLAMWRRFAMLREVLPYAIWTPDEERVRGSLLARAQAGPLRRGPERRFPPRREMTWKTFRERVLPQAGRISMKVPSRGLFLAVTTAYAAGAPPILLWDLPGMPNPFSFYGYGEPSPAGNWTLQPGTLARVDAVVPTPPHFVERVTGTDHPWAEGVVLILRGAVDQNEEIGTGLVPVVLKEELRRDAGAEVAWWSERDGLLGRDRASACGYDIRPVNTAALNCLLVVTERAETPGGPVSVGEIELTSWE